ncbi:MAG: FkbM family methyltransferase [Clostridia bacterium]|nr:FkbM family methyltransferase [Clostridia bacterium]
MQIKERCDVWQRMAECGKPIVLYGMGNGADKILSEMERRGLQAAGVFASDGFVRGHSFHGMRVMSYTEACERFEDMLIVIAFASSLPDVLARFDTMDARYETVAPDVPVSGSTYFTWEWFCAHRALLEEACALLADEESRRIFEALVNYKLSGKLCYLREAVSDEREVTNAFVKPETVAAYMDLGAYNGDTVRKMLDAAPGLKTVYAMEPDARNFRKLSQYAQQEERAAVSVYPYAAWSKREDLVFCAEGNRNSTARDHVSSGVPLRQAKERIVAAEAPDTILNGAAVDFIKYDVEGAEREALLGTSVTLRQYAPTLLVSLYHRTEDLYDLPLLVHQLQPRYALYLRRFSYVPAWDINLYCVGGIKEYES